MKTLNAREFNIMPGSEISAALCDMLDKISRMDGEKTVVFEKGTYYINSENCKKYMLYITNTVGDDEFSAGETPHLNAVPFYFNGISDLTFDGNGSVFVIDGKVTNAAVEKCRNITLENMEFRHVHPDMHELKVVKVAPFFVDFEIDRDSLFAFNGNKLYFFGKDYRVAADKDAAGAYWIGLVRKDTPDKIKRVRHPLAGALKITELKNRRIRVYYLNTFRFKIADCFYIYDVRRQFAGIFINQSENVVLRNIKQRFNYSLALVLQDCENVEVDHVAFAPEKDSARKMASVADFIQVCMCRGKISVTNSLFDGAGDDCINVHGVHFKIISVCENKIKVRFMHSQSHGYLPVHAGDEIAFIDPDTLLQTGKAKVLRAALLNEYEIELTLDSAAEAAAGKVIEDITACPDILFANNTLNRIITRACLFTTRGKVVVENNHFISNSMSGILLSDDAKSWYESGMCREVTIRNNTFDYCGKTPVLIKPENRVHGGAVHKNILIENNVFKRYKGYCVYAKSSENIVLKNNAYNSSKHIKTKNCNHVREID